MIKKENPDIIINAAAYTQVDKAETNEEIAYKMGYINQNDLKKIAKNFMNSGYGEYLISLINEDE